MAGTTGTTGTAFLLAASPMGKGCLVDAASVLPVLAAVSPAVLSGTDTANVVELADPLEPQAVLTRLRAAAVAPGPLTIYLTGQLQLDRKQHLPHLALARTTPATVRYTGFPWHWIGEELRLRAPGTTTLFLDLHADAAAWQYVTGRPFEVGRGVSVYGRVAPPPGRRVVAVPAYMRTVATILRSGYRPDAGQLHQQALGRLSSEGAALGDVVLAWDAGVNGGVFSPPPPLPVPSVPGGFAPRPPERAEHARPQTPDGLERRAGAEGAPQGLQVPAAATELSAGAKKTSTGADQIPDGLKALTGAAEAPGRPEVLAGAAEVPGRPEALAGPETAPGRGEAAAGRGVKVPGHGEAAAGRAEKVPGRGDKALAGAEKAPHELDMFVAAENAPAQSDKVPREPDSDPHTFITSAVQAGRHGDADALAAQWEQAAYLSHGAASEEALHWTEVRADLAMFAGDPARSCRAWLAVAGTRLSAGQAPDAPAVEAAVDRAHHQWTSLGESADARELGPVVVELRRRVPGRREGALRHAERQLEKLGSAQRVPG
ncbi:hypothetical protein [Streptomyces sp. GQFP]|uniref:hypothetical protein n=1 Tax=Streptomyces sp. GQFP TaxID=2907545 RepID=UPI001F301A17|nr:hypothetical protein [Streptomyces sp. GQFP]UIX32523.1 hypothetical protein LUX31_22170 [Streptomyces sp. GQFP]